MGFPWWKQLRAWFHAEKKEHKREAFVRSDSIHARKLDRILITNEVIRTIFDDYREHRASARGHEEIGWVLVGTREPDRAIAFAALPAGMQRQAGLAHVQFNAHAQQLGSYIVRQKDRRLRVIGVVHTHPGGMRHPSEGDFAGDRAWVTQLSGGEGIFAIGTADATSKESATVPGGQQLSEGELCFSWYSLGEGDLEYRPLPVEIIAGPDLARPLQPVWNMLEAHAVKLNRLCRQLARVQIEVVKEDGMARLCVQLPLAAPEAQLRLLLSETEARYYWVRQNEIFAIDPGEPSLDRAVYLILAELAKEEAAGKRETRSLAET